MVDLVHSLLCLKGDDPAAAEVTKLVLKLGLADGLDSPSKSNSSLPSTPWGSPKLRSKSRTDSSKSPVRSGFRIMSFFDRKTPPPDERKSSFYVDVEDSKNIYSELSLLDGIPTVSVTSSTTNEEENQPYPGVNYQCGNIDYSEVNNTSGKIYYFFSYMVLYFVFVTLSLKDFICLLYNTSYNRSIGE